MLLGNKNRLINTTRFKVTAALLIVFIVVAPLFIKNYHTQMLDKRRQETTSHVNMAHELLYYYQDKVEKGILTPTQAKDFALESVRLLSPQTEKYYWVLDTNFTTLMHPNNPEYTGRNMNNYIGPDGQAVFKDMVHLAKTDSDGFLDYLWQKPNGTKGKLYPKLSYVKLYKPWGWIIGSGTYTDDLNRSFLSIITIILSSIVIILTFTMSLSMTISKGLRKT